MISTIVVTSMYIAAQILTGHPKIDDRSCDDYDPCSPSTGNFVDQISNSKGERVDQGAGINRSAKNVHNLQTRDVGQDLGGRCKLR